METQDRVDFVKKLILSPDQPVVNITHSADADGHVSGIICKKFFKDVMTIATNHGKTIDWYKVPRGSIVIITDFSLPVDEMRRLCANNTGIWIDHHRVYLEPEYQEFANLEGFRSTAAAACYLTWEYFFDSNTSGNITGLENVPNIVKWVSDYDIWEFKYQESLAFNYGLGLYNIMPSSISASMIQKLCDNNSFVNAIASMGSRISSFVDERNKILCKWNGFRTNIFGIPGAAINMRNTSSKVLDPLVSGDDLLCTFGYNSQIRKYRCSVYTETDKHDCNELVKRLGGGGHASAAGCSCAFNELPIELPTPSENPPDEENFVMQIQDLYRKDPILNRYALTGVASLIRLNGWEDSFEGMSAYFINSPVWTIETFYATNMIADYELAIFWSLSNSGWFRYRISSLEKNHMTPEQLTSKIPGGIVKGSEVWCYRKTPPVDPITTSEEQQASSTYTYRRPYQNNGYNRWRQNSWSR